VGQRLAAAHSAVYFMQAMRFFVILITLVVGVRAEPPKVGPAAGALVIHGGGRLDRETVNEIVKLAGGPEAPFVIIPTADEGDPSATALADKSFLRRAGVTNITVLHTRDRDVANSPAFCEPLTKSRGVWLGGGRQWRLADAYLGTRVVTELHALLARGGVIAGSSAGATIQGSYMVRGAPEGNHIMMAKGHEEGFGFLKNTAIDQHVIARKREADLLPVIAAHPALLGLGIDEGTAIIVQGDRARVVGASKLVVNDAAFTPGADGRRYFHLGPGEVLDLVTRRKVAAH
jgi:cyanophycinase